jgi:hypothetical protein
MFVNAEPELVTGISLLGLFFELPASLPADFRMIVLGFAGMGVRYPLPGVGILPFNALFEWSPLKL